MTSAEFGKPVAPPTDLPPLTNCRVQEMNKGGRIVLDTERNQANGIVAEIEIGRDNESIAFQIVDVTSEKGLAYLGIDPVEIDPTASYLVVQAGEGGFDWHGDKGYKGIRAGENPISFGREQNPGNRFNIPPESRTISREHFQISFDQDGRLAVEDMNSVNQPYIKIPRGYTPATEAQYSLGAGVGDGFNTDQEVLAGPSRFSPIARTAGDVMLPGAGIDKPQGMITSFEDWKAEKDAQEVEKQSEIDRKRDEINKAIDELKSPYSEEVQINMWRYASGLINKADAQQAGNGSESTAFGQQAGQAWRELTPDQQQAAERYHRLMKQADKYY